MATKLGRIMMLYPHGAFSTVRGLVDAACLLADAGYEVEVYYRRTPDFIPDRLSYPGVMVMDDQPALFLKGPVSLPSFLRRGTGPYRRFVTNGPHAWWRRHVFLPRLRRRHDELPYTCIIGLDWHGIIAAGPLARALDVPLVNWSLELLFRDDLPPHEPLWLKDAEVSWSRASAFTIIQDKWRRDAFCAENGVDPSTVMLVPNAPRGTARRAPEPRLREQYGIPDETSIAICTGFIRPWAMSLELAQATRDWPERFILYLQSKARQDGDTTPYNAGVTAAAEAGRVLLGRDPVPADRFRALVDSADIGVALYDPRFRVSGKLDLNMHLMGHASGKVADYLLSGLPIVTTRLPGLAELVDSSGCGVCVDDPAETGPALEAIAGDYARYSTAACRCFDEKLELRRHFAPVIERISRL